MKKLKKYLWSILFLAAILFPFSHVKAATNPYRQSGPYGTNCTWYAWKMAYEKAGITLPGWGNAKDWYNDARNSGYTVGTTPKANSIIVWGGWTSYGHVGYVESVDGNTLYVWDSTGPCIDRTDKEFQDCMANSVNEDTDRLCYDNAKPAACEYTISPDRYGITGYIYLDNPPKVVTPSPTPSPKPSSTPKATPPTDVVVTKSSNNNLSNIELSSGSLTFHKDTLEYHVTVENSIDKITINATPEDAKATIQGTGDFELKEGLNEIKLSVTAEDGSIKEYSIQITREELQEPIEIEKIEEIPSNETSNNDHTLIIIIVASILVFGLLILCFFLFLRRKKQDQNKKQEQEEK